MGFGGVCICDAQLSAEKERGPTPEKNGLAPLDCSSYWSLANLFFGVKEFVQVLATTSSFQLSHCLFGLCCPLNRELVQVKFSPFNLFLIFLKKTLSGSLLLIFLF